ncbi:MAG: acyl-CoA reductase [Saprospiraceae bacterium]|nr:acyl-CoA reductase [Saprospiraceae bacterium]
MVLKERLELLVKLGSYLQEDSELRQNVILEAERQNRWMTKANSLKALENLSTEFLSLSKLENWLKNYPKINNNISPKKIGIVLAGNIPAVGFHDILCTFLCGHHSILKYSDKDRHLIPFMIDYLIKQDKRCNTFFHQTNRLKDFDAVIATGSNNSALYFEQYFAKYPNIIRKNRNSIAILNGNESDEELLKLGIDIFRYFGLGCRSVSKLYVTEGYDFTKLLSILDNYKNIMDHTKYRNNYEYNRSIYLLNNVVHFANDCLMLVEHESMLSRISSVHYEYYNNLEDLQTLLKTKKEEIQCIATNINLSGLETVCLGETQSPALSDFADSVDTMEFLIALNS